MRSLLIVFYLLLVGRLFLLDGVLEPTNDEGLWQWNARCEQWNLPAHGILHSALSPVNHAINRVLFALVLPSVMAKRIVCSLLVAAAAGFACLRLVRRGNAAGAAMLLAWLWLDPYLFRMGSWAILEPLLMFGLVAWYGIGGRRELSVRDALMLGVLTGLLIGVKLTIIWLPAGVCASLLFTKKFKELAVFMGVTTGVIAICYVSVYLCVDHERFKEIWRQHMVARTDPVANVLGVFRGLPDFRTAFYAATALLGGGWCVWRAFRSGSALGAAPWAVIAGLAALATQSCRPERYFFPVAFLSLLAAMDAGLFRECHRRVVALFLIVAMCANVLWWRNFVISPANAGGWAVHEKLKDAAVGRIIAAPPCLALDLRCDVQPTSMGLLALPADENYHPDVLAVQIEAAEPTSGDSRMTAELIRRQAVVTAKGFYRLYEAPAAPSPTPAK
ncbi:MAG: hypothetical protein K9N47_24760 [Prosthecobacter sp.]|uniref:hypothetical protein n=1 Tax=Prosthecobacter sp. TaxID=1965333 RepID=UPI002633127A|nr:hypothetical protein [Prosthecobacter sp.]MCF7789357.1 hypothetical protein [Prosthecobacter sp.]